VKQQEQQAKKEQDKKTAIDNQERSEQGNGQAVDPATAGRQQVTDS